MTRHIGILTGGGDVPGLNACIKSVTQQALERGWRVTGIRRGWAGLMGFDPADEPASWRNHCLPLTAQNTRTIDQSGGTFLHTSRTNPRTIKKAALPAHIADATDNGDGTVNATAHVVRMIEFLGLDAVIAIGGDGTLNFAAHLHGLGVPVILIPKTMDNDVFGTDYCIGFSTAVTRGVDAVTALRTTVASHERIGVVGLFGRRSGETALLTGYLAGVDRIVISEVPVDLDRLAGLVRGDYDANPSSYAMIVVSEGAQISGGGGPADLTKQGIERSGQEIGAVIGTGLGNRLGLGVVHQELAYLMRAGAPDALDRMVAQSFGALAVQLLDAGRAGLMTALQDGNYTAVPAYMPTKGKKLVDVANLYDPAAYRAKIAHIAGKPMFLY